MCGIGGIFSRRESLSAAEAMSDALRHRGPDDKGMARLTGRSGEGFGWFAHRRLSIIDLSASGHQPMFSPDDRLCVTYNGEIYNYRELRAELENDGVRFRTSCDTEVLLMGWHTHGAAFLERLRGMFAFAIWDREAGRGYLARDAFGIKPLYVTERSGEVLFASEVRPLMATGKVDPVLSPAAVSSYLFTGSVAEPATIIDGVFAVPPGCVVEVGPSNTGFETRVASRFITPFPPTPDTGLEFKPHVHRVRNALRESVRYHLVSDVPVAVFLSGGIDSSAVAGLASEVSAMRLDSFTVTFSEQDFSEALHAREAARRFGTVHHEIPLSGRDLLDALPDVFGSMDQPSLDGLNTFVVSRAVRSFGIKVVLSGLGGDELFGGYPSFERARLMSPLWKIPRAVRRVGALGASPIADLRAERMRAVLTETNPAFAAYRASRTLFSERQLEALTGVSYPGGAGMSRAPDDVEPSSLGLMQQVSLHELTGYMRNTLLRDSDVFSMAHALELRVPLVDLNVARAAAAASGAMTGRFGFPKPVLVEAVRDLLSPETINRPKRGFTLPFETWMRKELFGEVDSVLTQFAPETIGLQRGAVAGIWSQFQRRRPGVNWSRPWALYTLIRWASDHGLGGVAEDGEKDSEMSLLQV